MKLHNGYYKSKINRQKALTGFLFSLPTIFGLVVLFCLPMLGSLRMAFSQVSPARTAAACSTSQPACPTSFTLSGSIPISLANWWKRCKIWPSAPRLSCS